MVVMREGDGQYTGTAMLISTVRIETRGIPDSHPLTPGMQSLRETMMRYADGVPPIPCTCRKRTPNPHCARHGTDG